MKTQIFKYIKVLGLLSSVFVISCTERIDIELDNTYARLVVDGQITNVKTKQWVKLRRSGNALNSIPVENISNAIVSISDGTNVFNLTESPSKPGLYETADTVKGEPGKTYFLTIKNVDIDKDNVLEEYTANCKLKNEDPIDTITLMRYERGDFKGHVINMYAQEIGGGRNFYMLKAYKNGVLLTDSVYEISFSDNLGFEGKYYNGFTVYGLDDSKKDEELSKGDTVMLELNAITREYYDFLIAFREEYYPKMPIFSGPSSNVPTNIKPSEKAVGFFTAHSVERKSTIKL